MLDLNSNFYTLFMSCKIHYYAHLCFIFQQKCQSCSITQTFEVDIFLIAAGVKFWGYRSEKGNHVIETILFIFIHSAFFTYL